ncbi:Bicarbonate transport ATP-binding protein CmpC [bioreactor metagenome]|uniref:Bicarbonate transport ATP-binding protein CmpC n=1 Tax=bioreactor metagenome TaxID=1076179 RepID=A0A645E7R5_9ZZZZ
METINKEEMISVKNINKKFNEKVVFKDFDIDFYKNEVNCIIGKSGCGKSTLLNIISGIIPNDKENFETIEKYGVSYIFQDDRLIDWLTVGENITLVVKKLYNKKKCEELCDKYLDLVGIKEYKNYYPQMLSGGLRQRVNIARAFIYPSKIIIMDEPFKSIDVINKKIIMNNFKEILEREERTVLFVTHDIEEALLLSDKIYVFGNSPIEIKKVFMSKKITKEEIYNVI